MVTEAANREFTVVLRCQAALRLPCALVLNVGPLKVTYRSRQVAVEGGNIAGDLWVEIIGPAASLDEALEPFAASGLLPLPLLALVTNAAIGDCFIELGFESTEGVSAREFFQSYVPQEQGFVRMTRRVPTDDYLAVSSAVIRCAETERVHRAANQYLVALENWSLGHESLAVAHLWMGVEALTKAALRREMRLRHAGDEQQLADMLGIEKKKLDSTIRRDIVLQGDNDIYSQALAASDGFEHGFMEFGAVRKKALKVRNRLAALLRHAILVQADVADEVIERLEAAPYEKPAGMRPLTKYVRAKLVGSAAQLGGPESPYPHFQWAPRLQLIGEPNADGSQEARFDENLQVVLGDGLSFEDGHIEVWKDE